MSKESSGSEADGWAKISIRKKMKEEVDDFVSTDEAKKHGLTNSTQFIDISVRETLEKYQKTRFEHLNFHDNIIRIIDNDKPKGSPYVEVYFKNNKIVCGVCNSRNCIHIVECWNNDTINKILKAKDIPKLV